jgi:hypothetical protein
MPPRPGSAISRLSREERVLAALAGDRAPLELLRASLNRDDWTAAPEAKIIERYGANYDRRASYKWNRRTDDVQREAPLDTSTLMPAAEVARLGLDTRVQWRQRPGHAPEPIPGSHIESSTLMPADEVQRRGLDPRVQWRVRPGHAPEPIPGSHIESSVLLPATEVARLGLDSRYQWKQQPGHAPERVDPSAETTSRILTADEARDQGLDARFRWKQSAGRAPERADPNEAPAGVVAERELATTGARIVAEGHKAADTARAQLTELSVLRRTLEDPRSNVAGAWETAFVQRGRALAASLGWADQRDTTNGQSLFTAFANRLIPTLHTTGGVMSDNDARMYQLSLPHLQMNRENALLLTRILEETSIRTMRAARIREDVLKRDGSLGRANEEIQMQLGDMFVPFRPGVFADLQPGALVAFDPTADGEARGLRIGSRQLFPSFPLHVVTQEDIARDRRLRGDGR